MKLTKWTLGAALAVALWGRGASAQQDEYYRATAPRLGGAEAVIADDESATTYASTPVAAQPVNYGTVLGGDGGEGACDDACDCDCGPCCYPLADLGEAFKLFDGCFFQERNINAGGWIAQSFTWNPYQPNDRFNGPATWTDRANEYQMNEAYLYFGRAANTEGCGWDYGYRADMMYGTNYRWTTAAGLETNFDNGQFYGLSLPQLYGEVAYNDVTVKVGHFLSPVGYFAVGTANNFFPILPYTFQYGEPFTHTGALATWKVSDKFTWGNGFTRGWDNFDSTGNPNLGYLGTATYTLDNSDTLAWVGVYGREPNLTGANFNAARGVGFSTRYLQTLVYTRKFNENTTGILQSDYGVQGDAAPRTNGGVARWYGINTYLLWNQTCRLQWGANFEWFRDEGGARVGAAVPSFGSPDARGYAQPAGFDGSFYRVTVGPKYFFTPNLYTRAALAADWYSGSTNLAGNQPFDDGTKNNQQLAVFDLVLTF